MIGIKKREYKQIKFQSGKILMPSTNKSFFFTSDFNLTFNTFLNTYDIGSE